MPEDKKNPTSPAPDGDSPAMPDTLAPEAPQPQPPATATLEHGGGTEKPAHEDPQAPVTEEASPEASAPATESPQEDKPAPKGISFLGRRGTGAIRVAQPDSEGEKQPDAAANDSSAASALAAPEPLKPGMAENAFRAMTFVPLLFLLIILALQTAAGVWFPSVYLPAEVAVAETFAQLSTAGQWLIPPATDALPAALPGYFWFMGLVNLIPMEQAFFLPVAAALASLVALAGVYTLGLCTNLGKRVSFTAGLILLASPGFAPLTHYLGQDMLLAGLLALSLGCLYRGWVSDFAPGWLSAGFLLTAAATLVGGLPALWIPLVSSLVFVFWRTSLRRAHKLDAVIGFGILLFALAAWLGAVILLTGEGAKVLGPLAGLLIAPWQPPLWPPQDPWWQGLALLILSLLPWALVPIFVSWGKVITSSWSSLKAARQENSGTAWLWIVLFSALPLLLFGSLKPWLMAVPLLPIAALLLSKALLNLSPVSSRLFYLLLALFCLICGVAFTVAGIPAAAPFWTPYVPQSISTVIAAMQGLPILAAISLLAAVALLRFTNRAYPGGALAVFVLFVIMLMQPATLLTGPSLAGVVAAPHTQGMGLGVLPGQPAPKAPAAASAPAATPDAATPPVAKEATEATEAPATIKEEQQQAPAPLAVPAPQENQPQAAPETNSTAAPKTPAPEAAPAAPAAPEAHGAPAIPEDNTQKDAPAAAPQPQAKPAEEAQPATPEKPEQKALPQT